MHNKAIFLGIQYRMPHVIGEFISRHVYDRRLQTQHSITSRSACRFVDVLNGKEEKSGKSWVNRKEAGIVVNICRIYEKQSKAFRVITPYDAQRSLIEKELESAKLKWENKCFNVDSFQGNEDEHIIISLVRSEGVGFLKNNRRTNVMLTRCKKSMVICTSRSFITKKAASSLMGKLAATVGPVAWVGVEAFR
ncbi:hypothetical protein SERLA73DRAFT_136902 [Serpula lacrymans var. lacrymans S7.3]|uniref:DNA2/NAM7 helicase-like C-terminal domain-containing protein n=1 Tax=Serpula lacrymans var. lacrymans (strain S7.3) TaxID=936435 RepID=F8PYC3_SERL3|nr:hypothetical protein SERLA73DRAFT_136902 [Serpula lacrymans var. lacrymans S7.3]